jgi:hypothetical protein
MVNIETAAMVRMLTFCDGMLLLRDKRLAACIDAAL